MEACCVSLRVLHSLGFLFGFLRKPLRKPGVRKTRDYTDQLRRNRKPPEEDLDVSTFSDLGFYEIQEFAFSKWSLTHVVTQLLEIRLWTLNYRLKRLHPIPQESLLNNDLVYLGLIDSWV